MKRIGLFGGSFDPVHHAHLALTQIALEHLRLDELLSIPVGQPWQKARQLARGSDRAAMVTLAIEHEPRFKLESCELRRIGPSYTIDTVRELQALQLAQWFLIIGQDQYVQLHTWHGWRELVALITLAVANRAGDVPKANAELEAAGARLIELPLAPTSVSATGLRIRVALGQDITAMVPVAVARYIENHGLYRVPLRS